MFSLHFFLISSAAILPKALSSLLHYCNRLLIVYSCFCPCYSRSKIQKNILKHKFDHVTPLLKTLQWLPLVLVIKSPIHLTTGKALPASPWPTLQPRLLPLTALAFSRSPDSPNPFLFNPSLVCHSLCL